MNLYNMTYEELEDYFISINDKKYRASQIYDWLYKKRVTNINDMTNINVEVRSRLNNDFNLNKISIKLKQESIDVKKYLFELTDKETVEAVLMNHDYGTSLCISSQVGCNMGCLFCESGRLKRIRNLEIYEMVEQILLIEKDINKRISHVVIMGIGEPFDNYDNVIKFIKIINSNKGIDIGIRHITVSTCGIVPKIEEFSKENMQVNLAISLHAPNDEIRNRIMPINKVYNINSLINSVKKYISNTNRRVTFEYILLEGINDSKENAHELANLLSKLNCYVNLIPYNETSNNEFKRTKNDKIREFYDILKKKNINVTVRRKFGSEIDAACGQLRANNYCN